MERQITNQYNIELGLSFVYISSCQYITCRWGQTTRGQSKNNVHIKSVKKACDMLALKRQEDQKPQMP